MLLKISQLANRSTWVENKSLPFCSVNCSKGGTSRMFPFCTMAKSLLASLEERQQSCRVRQTL